MLNITLCSSSCGVLAHAALFFATEQWSDRTDGRGITLGGLGRGILAGAVWTAGQIWWTCSEHPRLRPRRRDQLPLRSRCVFTYLLLLMKLVWLLSAYYSRSTPWTRESLIDAAKIFHTRHKHSKLCLPVLSRLVAAVAVSGIKILSMGDGFSRRNRFILACACALGLGVTLVPQVGVLWVQKPAAALRGIARRVVIN